MSAVFNIDWRKFTENYILVAVRKPIFLKLLRSFIQPVLKLYVEFHTFRDGSLYKVRHNSQVVYLQKMLNDKFDATERRIKIENAVIKEPVWFYEPDDNKPVWFYEPEDNKPVRFREETDFIGDGVDFSVLVPIALKPTTPQTLNAYVIKMSAQINYYKLFSKNYKIVWIS